MWESHRFLGGCDWMSVLASTGVFLVMINQYLHVRALRARPMAHGMTRKGTFGKNYIVWGAPPFDNGTISVVSSQGSSQRQDGDTGETRHPVRGARVLSHQAAGDGQAPRGQGPSWALHGRLFGFESDNR